MQARDLEKRRLVYEAALPGKLRALLLGMVAEQRRTGHLSRGYTRRDAGLIEAIQAGYVEGVRLKGDAHMCWYVTQAGLDFLASPPAPTPLLTTANDAYKSTPDV